MKKKTEANKEDDFIPIYQSPLDYGWVYDYFYKLFEQRESEEQFNARKKQTKLDLEKLNKTT